MQKLIKTVCLEPNLITESVQKNIQDRLKSIYLKKCTRKNGYIVSIHDRIKIISNTITDNGSILFYVEFYVETLKPYIGQIVKGEVFMVFDGGIFVMIEGEMKVLIPVFKLSHMTYNKAGYFEHNNSRIKISDNIDVKIDQIEYEKCKFNCIGSLAV